MGAGQYTEYSDGRLSHSLDGGQVLRNAGVFWEH